MYKGTFIAIVIISILSMEAYAKDGSSRQEEKAAAYEDVCMAAMVSKQSAKRVAREHKIGRRELSRIQCNDMSVMEFVKLHSESADNWSIATVR